MMIMSTLADGFLSSLANPRVSSTNNSANGFLSAAEYQEDKSIKDRVSDRTDRFMDTTNQLYQPWQDTGAQAGNQARSIGDMFLGMKTPEAGTLNNDFLAQLAQQYGQTQIPGAVDVTMPTGPDYGAARESNLYKQMQNQATSQYNNNAALSGGSVRGGNNQLDIARGARSNLVNSADQLYKNDMAEYQSGMQQNQLRNNMLNNQFGNTMRLQQLKNQNQQGNFNNQMANYNMNQQNIKQYLSQLGQNATTGFNQLGNYMGLNQGAINSQIGSLNSIYNIGKNADAAEAQKRAGDTSAGMGIVSSVAKMF